MPQLNEISKQRKQGKFKKKEYRPWDLAGTNKTEKNSIKTEGQELGNELDNNQVTIREQSGNNQGTIREQLGNESGNNRVTIREQLGNELDNELGNKEYVVEAIEKLSGVQKNIFLSVLGALITSNRLDTGNISTKQLANKVQATVGTTKTSINRLIKKGIIQRKPGKTSRGGYICLAINENTRNTALKKYKGELSILLGNELGNNLSYNSSSNKNTTTKELPEEWASIDYDALQSIGFSMTQLKQLCDKKLNIPETVQESINCFAFGLENNEKYKKYENPLNVLMGVLRKGGAWTESAYESPKDKALREMLERRKEQEAKRKSQMEELFTTYFDPWYDKQSDDFLKNLTPKGFPYKRSSIAVKESAKNYYSESSEWRGILSSLEAD